jgi:hypothetical protein
MMSSLQHPLRLPQPTEVFDRERRAGGGGVDLGTGGVGYYNLLALGALEVKKKPLLSHITSKKHRNISVRCTSASLCVVW